ncbi:MAG: aminotransferase class V-fold PLP-dependent enzyme, partial [Leeuwenhoekiella sp.]
VRETVGRFFNCNAGRVALLPNFSFGFNILLEGLPAGTKFLLLEQDYPSINWAVKARDFKVTYANIDANLEDNILSQIEKEKPDVLALSLVQYINGIQIDFNFLKEIKASFPDLLIIADGTQYCGVAAFDFENSGIDVLGASTYKWMNAGYGNGFFLFKQNVEERVFAKTIGFNSISGKYKAENSFIGKFEPGHQDTLAFGSLDAAIRLIDEVGISTIETKVKELREKAMSAFAEKGLLENDVLNRKQHSSIFNIKGDEKLFARLREHKIICSPRGSGLRVSFHYFNTNDDFERLLEII